MIVVIDLGISSVTSIRQAFQRITDRPVQVISEGPIQRGTRLLVMPGNGNFGVACTRLESSGLDNQIKNFVQEGDGKFAGICLGMQLMGNSSEEAPGARGLRLIDAETKKLNPKNSSSWKLPNIGWRPLNKVSLSFGEIDKTKEVFFSHSFFLESNTLLAETMTSRFDEFEFTAAIRHENIVGFQFHPEKSSVFGMELLTATNRWAGIDD